MSRRKARGAGSTPGHAERSIAADTGLSRRRYLYAVLITGFIVLAGVTYFVFRSSPYARGSHRNANVVLVTVDTLRADHLPVYGYRGVRTPALDGFSATSLIFEDVLAHAPITLPSHASILTGLIPAVHGVAENGSFVLSSRFATLAEILKGHGYETAAFVSSYVLDSRFGLDRGFDTYYDDFDAPAGPVAALQGVERRAGDTEAKVEEWLSRPHGKPFFLWVHYYDPHEPYAAPEPYGSEYASAPYDGEIAYTDTIFGRLLNSLSRMQADGKTIVVFTSDHGEGLGDHGEATHSVFLYGSTLRVPLLIRVPGGKQQRVVQTAGQIDLAPTLLEWLGISVPPQMNGRSLIPLLQHREREGRPVYSESLFAQFHYGWSPLRSITTGRYKYIQAPRPELYDRKQDPQELVNLLDSSPEVARELSRSLEASTGKPSAEDRAPVELEASEKLYSLGYISGTVSSTPASLQIDPKDRIAVLDEMESSLGFLVRGELQKALDTSLAVVAKEPSLAEAHSTAGTAYAGLGDYDNAVKELSEAIRLQPDHGRSIRTLAWVYETRGDLQQAEVWYLKLAQAHRDPFPRLKLAEIYRRMSLPDKALQYEDEALSLYRADLEKAGRANQKARILSAMGDVYFSSGRLDLAERSLREAATLSPDLADVHFNLAQIYEMKNDPASARTEYESEIRAHPRNARAQLNLGLLYRSMSLIEPSNDCFKKVLELQPNNPYAPYLLAENYYYADQDLNAALGLAQQAVSRKPDFLKALQLMVLIYQKQGRDAEADALLGKIKQVELARNSGIPHGLK